MHRLHNKKLVTIVTIDALESRLVDCVKRNKASGYTILKARGSGSSGEISGLLDIDTNIKFHVVMSESKLPGLLTDVEYLLNKGYHMTLYVSDVSVLCPEKFDAPLK